MTVARTDAQEDKVLPILREDLLIEPAGAFLNGAPSWLIHDQIRNRFFRIGQSTLEILSSWRAVKIQDFIDSLSHHFGREINHEEVDDVAKFLYANSLTEMSPGENHKAFHDQEKSRKKSFTSAIIHNYLFFRIPLFNPSKVLDACWPFVRPFFSTAAIVILFLLAVISLYLVSRQWEVFTNTFLAFLSFEGAVLYVISLVLLKFLHEFGHAFMAKKYNVPVPVIGVAFLVLFPVLYTDTSAAARLKNRHKRLMINMAGIFTELAVAILATLFWVFLPDGPMRSIAFTTASLSWILSLAVNLNPFMRFDGYYILSDMMGVENLQQRGFDLAKWRLREILFKPAMLPPEVVNKGLRRFLIIHAWGTWIYRFSLFLGIAFLVYSFFIKIVGIFLFAVEILWFILLPVWREVKIWWGNRQTYLTRRSFISLICFGFALLFLCFPWSSRVDVPAVMKASREFRIFPLVDGQISFLNFAEKQAVGKGDILLKLASPKLESDIQISTKRKTLLETRLARASSSELELASISVLRQELKSETQNLTGLNAKRAELVIRAPFDGVLENVDYELHQGQWLSSKRSIAILRTATGTSLSGLVKDSELVRIDENSKGKFIPDSFFMEQFPVIITKLSIIAEARLEQEILGEHEGGLVAAIPDADGTIRPIETWFRVEMVPDNIPEGYGSDFVMRGLVVVDGVPKSYLSRIFRQIVSVLIRESGF